MNTIKDYSAYVCGQATSIRDVLARIDVTTHLFQMIVDEEGHLLGTVTDGDIRRAMLHGIGLDESVTRCMQRRPVVGHVGRSEQNKRHLATLGSSRPFLPVLDGEGRVVEVLVREGEAGIVQALVMAGGYGRRLGERTRSIPKPLLPVGGRPILDHVLTALEDAGVVRVHVSVHYLADKIRSFVAGRANRAEIVLIEEEEALGTAGALGRLDGMISGPILVVNGDVLTRVDLHALHDFQLRHGFDATVGVARHDIEVPFGVIRYDDDGLFESIEEKPSISNFIAAGVYYLGPEFSALVPQERPIDMPELLTLGRKIGLKIGLFPIHEYWTDVGDRKIWKRLIIISIQLVGSMSADREAPLSRPIRMLDGAAAGGIDRRIFSLLLIFHLVGTGMEVLGLFSLLPIFQFLVADGNVTQLIADQRLWRILDRAYGFVGVRLSLEALLTTTFLLLLLRQGVVYARLRFTAFIIQRAIATVRMKLFDAFLQARIEAQEKDNTGVVVNDMTTDLQNAMQYIMANITLIGLLFVFALYIVALVILSPTMTAVALVLFGCAFMILRSFLTKTLALGRSFTTANQLMSGFLVERLKQARLIRLARMEAAETKAMATHVEGQRDSMTRIQFLLAAVHTAIEPIVVFAGFVFLYLGVTTYKQPLESLALFMVVLMRLMPVVKELVRTRQSANGFRACFDNVFGRLHGLWDAKEKHIGGQPLIAVERHVRFDGVTFSYNGAVAPAVRKVSFTIPAHKMTALVGPSGAGKSTLVDLLPRLRAPTAGQILFDDIPQDDVDLAALRTAISYAPQRPELFNVPAREHIRYGKTEASDEEVRTAARLAQAEDFILALPDGYDTLIGDSGDRLSGGQRQRLDLARALVRRAPILVLDEPTSNLDADSEAKFLTALRQIRRETATTMVIIAHRLSTVAMADQIVVIDSGRVRAIGTHAELVARDTWYRDAFRNQQLSDDITPLNSGAA